MAFGVALAPRRLAGSMMGISALGSSWWLTATGIADFGSGAIVSLSLLGLDIAGRPFDSWWLQAIATYTASGLVAGLVGALCWFNFRTKDPAPGTEQAPGTKHQGPA